MSCGVTSLLSKTAIFCFTANERRGASFANPTSWQSGPWQMQPFPLLCSLEPFTYLMSHILGVSLCTTTVKEIHVWCSAHIRYSCVPVPWPEGLHSCLTANSQSCLLDQMHICISIALGFLFYHFPARNLISCQLTQFNDSFFHHGYGLLIARRSFFGIIMSLWLIGVVEACCLQV